MKLSISEIYNHKFGDNPDELMIKLEIKGRCATFELLDSLTKDETLDLIKNLNDIVKNIEEFTL